MGDNYYALVSYWFLENENYHTQNREVHTIWDALGETGGFLEIVAIVSGFILFHYTDFNFVSKFGEELYKEEKR